MEERVRDGVEGKCAIETHLRAASTQEVVRLMLCSFGARWGEDEWP